MKFTIENVSSRPVVGIREQTKMTEIGNKMGALVPELVTFAGDRVAGPPLARWHTWEGDAGEMEVAIPVREPTAGTDRIQASELPAGRAAIAMHIGPYDNLKDTWTALGEWMKEQALEPAGAPWEEYLSDCDQTPPDQLMTRIVWPVR